MFNFIKNLLVLGWLCASLGLAEAETGLQKGSSAKTGRARVSATNYAVYFLHVGHIRLLFVAYFQAHTYLGSDSSEEIAHSIKIAGKLPTKFATWAQANFPVLTA